MLCQAYKSLLEYIFILYSILWMSACELRSCVAGWRGCILNSRMTKTRLMWTQRAILSTKQSFKLVRSSTTVFTKLSDLTSIVAFHFSDLRSILKTKAHTYTHAHTTQPLYAFLLSLSISLTNNQRPYGKHIPPVHWLLWLLFKEWASAWLRGVLGASLKGKII